MSFVDIRMENRKTVFKILGLTLFSKEIDKAETVLKINCYLVCCILSTTFFLEHLILTYLV